MSREDCLCEIAPWEEAVCSSCGRLFPRRESYEKKCLFCYKLEKTYNILQGDMAFLWLQERLEVERKKVESALQAAEEQKLRAEKAEKRERKAPKVFSATLLKDMIFLCHPDRHANSDKATKVTKYLLSIRQRKK